MGRALVFLDAVYDWSGLLEMPGQPGFPPMDRPFGSFKELDAWYAEIFPELWGPLARRHLHSQVVKREEGRIEWRLPVPSPEFGAFANLWADWSGSEYSGIEVPVLSIQTDQESVMTSNLEARGVPEDEIEAGGAWAREYDNVAKQAGAAMLFDAVPHAVNIVLRDTHHTLLLHRPGEVVRLMEAFLGTQLEVALPS